MRERVIDGGGGAGSGEKSCGLGRAGVSMCFGVAFPSHDDLQCFFVCAVVGGWVGGAKA